MFKKKLSDGKFMKAKKKSFEFMRKKFKIQLYDFFNVFFSVQKNLIYFEVKLNFVKVTL